ncbi:hypothetical protein O0L34_g6762 [Tuta absoluta]|nr:hypothetical protein O0L34_g6762 [Tuta absoluta]
MIMTYLKTNILIVVIVVLSYNFAFVAASEGDRSLFYDNCWKYCVNINCTGNGTAFTKKAARMQDQWSRLVGHDCRTDCRYQCMWRTVDAFEERGMKIPKFHGKWPFKRVLGLQEPVSVLGSLLNLVATVYMYRKLVKDKRFTLRNSPLLYLWHIFSAVCVNTWIWSTLFHIRDTPFTEFMDYACALSFVFIHFIAGVIRLLYRKPLLAGLIVLFTVLYFAEHCRYLYQALILHQGRIDYDFNMTVNVIVGMVAMVLFMLFSLGALCGAGGGGTKGQLARRYVWRLVVFSKLTGATVLLELFDFPPYMRLIDAHALWHLCTSPLPLLFYGFIIDDLDYLLNARHIETKTDTKLA